MTTLTPASGKEFVQLQARKQQCAGVTSGRHERRGPRCSCNSCGVENVPRLTRFPTPGARTEPPPPCAPHAV
eukprot:5632273-Pyramimonas_sp.AAC.1